MDMNLTPVKKGIIVLSLIVIAFSAGRFSAPKSVQSKESDKTTTETQQNQDKNQNVTQDMKQTKLPDGTVITETHKIIQTQTETQTKKDSEAVKSIETKTESRPEYRLGVTYEPMIAGFQDMGYSARIEKRLFSEIYMGIEASSRRTIGLTLSLGF